MTLENKSAKFVRHLLDNKLNLRNHLRNLVNKLSSLCGQYQIKLS